jgi:hypothetical protein
MGALKTLILLDVFLLTFGYVCAKSFVDKNHEQEALAFLKDFNQERARLANLATIASWNYETNITDYNSQVSQEVGAKVRDYCSNKH